MNRLVRLALLAYLSAAHAGGGPAPARGQRPAAAEVKEPVTVVSWQLTTVGQTHTAMRGAPEGQPLLGRDLLTSRPSDLMKIRVRNDDHARTVTEIEYQLSRTNRAGGAEVARASLLDKVKVKPGKVSGERTLRWSPDRLGCGRHVYDCNLSLRILRVRYDDGSVWTHPLLSVAPRPG